jgi:predicted chitinase
MGDFDSICLGVNGGWNGYEERWAYYNVAYQVLGA